MRNSLATKPARPYRAWSLRDACQPQLSPHSPKDTPSPKCPVNRIFPRGSVKWRNIIVRVGGNEGNICGSRVRMQISQVCIPVPPAASNTDLIPRASHMQTNTSAGEDRYETAVRLGSACAIVILTNCNVITANLFTRRRIASHTLGEASLEEISRVTRGSTALPVYPFRLGRRSNWNPVGRIDKFSTPVPALSRFPLWKFFKSSPLFFGLSHGGAFPQVFDLWSDADI